MDIEIFLKERVSFAKYFHEQGCKPFERIMELIEQEKEPYEPVHDESGEPQYIYEWLQARDGVECIGLSALSMLSSSVQLYMNQWLDRVERPKFPFSRKGSKGWFNALKKCIESENVDFSTCPADLTVIEQLILARNRMQHAEDITSNTVSHRVQELAKFSSPLFVDPQDQALKYNWFGQPRVYAGKLQVDTVSKEILDFCEWLELEYRRIYMTGLVRGI